MAVWRDVLRQQGQLEELRTGRLDGKVALITGSDFGIGQAAAVEFAKEGADAGVTYLNDRQGAEETKRQVDSAGRRATLVQVDVSNEASVDAMFEAAILEFGTADILINNAGVDASGVQVADLSTEAWDRAIRTNLYGYFFCCRHFIRIRREVGGGGKIINITSVHDEIPRAGAADYDCSKGGQQNLTRTLALELAPLRINVNNIGPGMVHTPFNAEAMKDRQVREEQVRSIPWKRAAEPWEIARLAVYLASSDADYVTGATYYIDGGLMQNQGQGA
jgi:glucose 1-dehydrogenase